jgi:hypothetical protein
MTENMVSPRSISRIFDIAQRIGVDPRDAERAIALARTGRMDLIDAVAAGRLSIDAALMLARAAKVKI